MNKLPIYLHTTDTSYSNEDILLLKDSTILELYNSKDTYTHIVNFFDQKFYWTIFDIKNLHSRLESTNYNIHDSKIVINTLYEPRQQEDSLLVHYLLQKFDIAPENIIFLTCAQQNTKVLPSTINSVVLPTLGISFASVLEKPPIESDLPSSGVTKTKLFSCLTKRITPQRYVLTSLLYREFNPYIDYEMSLGVESEKIDVNRINHLITESVKAGGDIFFSEKLPLIFDSPIVDIKANKHYMMKNSSLQNCMFDIINESVGYDYPDNYTVDNTDNFNYSSEKSFRHLYNFQVPIFNCRPEYIEYFKETFKTDLFEDLLPLNEIYTEPDAIKRSIKIVKLLKEWKLNPTFTFSDIEQRVNSNFRRIHQIFLQAGNDYHIGLSKIKTALSSR